jgi:hypothetical protein
MEVNNGKLHSVQRSGSRRRNSWRCIWGELLGAYGNFSNFSSSGATLTQGGAFLSTMGNNPVANNPYSFGDAPSLNNGLGAFAGFAGSRSAQTLRSGSSERAAPANGPER